MPATHVHQLADFAVGLRGSPLPEEIAADVTSRIMDILGNSLAAYAEDRHDATAPARAVLAVVERWGGTAQARVVGSGEVLPAPSAALVNGTLAHALDFDDTHLPSVLHPSATVVPAVLAVAQEVGATGPQTLVAAAAGIEICNRLGMASYLPELRNSLFFEKGQHATSICGTLAAAAAAALLYELSADGVASAIGIAASMGAGVIEANRTGGTVKRVHCGWAAHAGVAAADLARSGITGPPTVLEGRFGFFQAWLDGRYDEQALLGGLGRDWELLRTVYKPYPSNHFTHPGIDCALELRSQGLDPDEVESAELGVAAPTLRTIAEPREEKIRPQTAYHGKFSGPYTVATALLGGGGLGVHLDDFAPGTHLDDKRLRLTERITCVADERASEDFPRAFGAVLKVRTRSGALLEHRVTSSRGGPENPLSAEELTVKFRANAERALDAGRTEELAERVRGLTDTSTAAEVLSMCTVD